MHSLRPEIWILHSNEALAASLVGMLQEKFKPARMFRAFEPFLKAWNHDGTPILLIVDEWITSERSLIQTLFNKEMLVPKGALVLALINEADFKMSRRELWKAREFGVSGYVTKPLDQERLCFVIERLFKEKEQLLRWRFDKRIEQVAIEKIAEELSRENPGRAVSHEEIALALEEAQSLRGPERLDDLLDTLKQACEGMGLQLEVTRGDKEMVFLTPVDPQFEDILLESAQDPDVSAAH